MIPVLEPYLDSRAKIYLNDCVDTNWISSKGKYVTEFESKFAKLFDYSNAMTVSNGTTALHLALETLGVGEGDEVIVPDLTFAATVNAVLHAGAVPVIVDVDENSFNISEEEILKNISPKTKAIIVVHLYGNPFDSEKLKRVLGSNEIFIIEDCAEALGARVGDRSVGSFADAATFSFFGNKVITTGEGGMIVYKNCSHEKKSRVLRDHGMSISQKYMHDYVGFNYRMTNMQAAVGVSQLEIFSKIMQKRRQIFQFYDDQLLAAGFRRSFVSKGSVECPWLYTVLIPDGRNRDELSGLLLEEGIETRPMFIPMSKMSIYEKYARNCVNSERISSFGISLPSSYSLSSLEQARICKTLIEWCDR